MAGPVVLTRAGTRGTGVASWQESSYLVECVSGVGVGNLDATVLHVPPRTFLRCALVHYESATKYTLSNSLIRKGGLQP